MAEREAAGQGLTRPELPNLLSYAKLVLFNDLITSDVPDDPGLGQMPHNYFPGPCASASPRILRPTRLALRSRPPWRPMESLTAWVLPLRWRRRTRQDVPQAMSPVHSASCWISNASVTFTARSRRGMVLAAFPLQAEMLMTVNRLARRSIEWLLRKPGQSQSIAGGHTSLAGLIAAISDGLAQVATLEIASDIDLKITTWTGPGPRAYLARAVAQLDSLAATLDIAQIYEISGSTHLLHQWRRAETGMVPNSRVSTPSQYCLGTDGRRCQLGRSLQLTRRHRPQRACCRRCLLNGWPQGTISSNSYTAHLKKWSRRSNQTPP